MKANSVLLLTFFISNIAFSQGWVPVGNPGFTSSGAGETSIHGLAIDWQGIPYIVTQYNGPNQAIVMKYDGSGWITLANGPLPSKGANLPSLAINRNGIAYTAFADHSTVSGGPPSVMKFDGSNWAFVGDTIIFSTGTFYTSIAISNQGVPFLAYSDLIDTNAANFKVSVMKFDGTNWSLVGIRGFSGWGGDYQTSIAVDNNSIPYVVFEDVDSAFQLGGITVMKYDGANWVTVGNRHFSSGFINWPVIAIDGNNTPYVVYENIVNEQQGGKATVMKFDGNDWVTVGGDYITDGVTSCTAIAIDSNNVPYVAYRDSLLGYKSSVKKFNGTSWELVGAAGFSDGDARYISFALSPDGIPYIKYSDFRAWRQSHCNEIHRHHSHGHHPHRHQRTHTTTEPIHHPTQPITQRHVPCYLHTKNNKRSGI